MVLKHVYILTTLICWMSLVDVLVQVILPSVIKAEQFTLSRKRKGRKRNAKKDDAGPEEQPALCTEDGATSSDAEVDSSSSLRKASLPLEFLNRETVPSKKCACYDFNIESSSYARFAYLIIVHNLRTVEDAVHAFQAIAAVNSIVVIHIDTKFSWEEFLNSSLYSVVNECRCGALVYVNSIFSPEWADWSMNEPTLWAMDLLSSHERFKGQWEVFINMSGDTMPTRTPKAMSRLFDSETGPLASTNFVTSSSCETGLVPTHIYHFPIGWHKREAHSTHPRGHPVVNFINDFGIEEEATIPTYFGSQWVILTRRFVEYLASSLQRKDSLVSQYRDKVISLERVVTDETFIPSLVMYLAKDTIPKVIGNGHLLLGDEIMESTRYERMDEHSPSSFGKLPKKQRMEVPEGSVVSRPHVWGPYFLGIYDLGSILRTNSLFIRKVSVQIDPNIVNLFPVDSLSMLPEIDWPEQIEISEKPNFEY